MGIAPAKSHTDAVGGDDRVYEHGYFDNISNGADILNVGKMAGLFPSGRRTFYLDPNGDTSLNTPGTFDEPFRDYLTALSALSKQYGVIKDGITLILNPGTYPYVSNGLICYPTVGCGDIYMVAADPSNAPIVQSNDFLGVSGAGIWQIANLHLRSAVGFLAANGGSIQVRAPCTFETTAKGQHFFRIEYKSDIQFFGGHHTLLAAPSTEGSLETAVSATSRGTFSAPTSAWTVRGLSAVTGCFARATDYSNMDLRQTTFNVEGSVTGMRYGAYGLSIINLGGLGVNFLPGSLAGQADATSFLL